MNALSPNANNCQVQFLIEDERVNVSTAKLIEVPFFERLFSPHFSEGKKLRESERDIKPEFKLGEVSPRIFRIWVQIQENNPLAEIKGDDDLRELLRFNDYTGVDSDRWLRAFIKNQFRFLNPLEIFQMGAGMKYSPCMSALPGEVVQQESIQAILRLFPTWVKQLEGCRVKFKLSEMVSHQEEGLTPEQKEALLQIKRFFPFSRSIDRIVDADLSELPEEPLMWLLSLIYGKATHLDLSRTQLKTCRILGWFKELQVLNLSHCTQLKSIKALKRCPKLTQLTLTGCSKKIEGPKGLTTTNRV